MRKRLLFLGDTLPYPPDRGLALRTYHVLRLLATRWDVSALFFYHRGDPTQMPLHDRVRHLEEVAHVEIFRIPGEWSVRRRWLDRARSVLARQSVTRWRFARVDYRRRLLELIMERDPRIIHVDRITLNGILPLLAGKTVVLNHHRVESETLRRRAELAGSLPEWYLERQAEWMEAVEREWLPRVTLNVARSEPDRDALAALAPDARIEAWPDGVDTEHFTPGRTTGKGLAYVGGARRVPDRDALNFFSSEILPRLRNVVGDQVPEPISWVGASSDEDRRHYREHGIDIMGYVEDIRPIVRPAACYIVPLRMATGARFKVLQAWAMGKAVVSTAAGCRGLEAVDGKNILIRDEPEGFARAVADVLQDAGLRARLGRAARETVERHHGWDRLGEAMLDRYEALEEERGTMPGATRPAVSPSQGPDGDR